MRLPRIPWVVAALAGRLPPYPPAAFLAAALNLYARDLFAPDEAQRVAGKVIAVRVRDAGLALLLRIRWRHFEACDARTAADATISADARDFVLLALRSIDPDTLFFDRRLMIEGDTDLGLIVKNALDRSPSPLPSRLADFLKQHLTV